MRLFTAAVIIFVLFAPRAAAQARPSEGGWNSPRALELVSRAQERRSESVADTGLVSYRAIAQGYVYFYLDREDTGERNLVKTDQLALEIFWQAPDQVKQWIIGWRDERSLPTNITYHLDHLSVVQENFGDEIRIGDGDEVRNVPHPAAPGAEIFYEYRLTDSLTLALPGAAEPVRVYQLQVRPVDPRQPAIVGSVFVERRRGDLVRMDFTFTAASYVDRYLDYINISLDNGLWRGRYWLPNEQRVELRRRLPQFDIPAGTVIRGNMRIGDYSFNEPLSDDVFAGPTVVTVPKETRQAYPFEQELHAEVREEGLGPQMELSEIREQAIRLARREALRNVTGVRLRVPAASDLVRYSRAEGLVLGAGLGATPVAGLRIGGIAGYAFGAAHPIARVSLEAGTRTRLTGAAYLNRARDLGIEPAASGLMNTLSALAAGEDYRDVFHATGAELGLARELDGPWSWRVTARAESQDGPDLVETRSPFGSEFRPVAPIDEAELALIGSAGVSRRAPSEASGWGGAAALEAGGHLGGQLDCVGCEPARWLKPIVEGTWARHWMSRAAALEVRGSAGAGVGELPLQELFRIGGRGTVPGHAFRAYVGDRYAAVSAVVSADLARPWFRGRLLASAGAVGSGSGSREALARWEPAGSDRFLSGIGAGVGLFYDLLRVDVARGLGRDGRWELIVDTRRAFWDFL